jgi:hypothetical protein
MKRFEFSCNGEVVRHGGAFAPLFCVKGTGFSPYINKTEGSGL